MKGRRTEEGRDGVSGFKAGLKDKREEAARSERRNTPMEWEPMALKGRWC